MPSPVQPSPSPSEGEKHRQLNKDIWDMVSAITHRATDFHKSGSTHRLEKDDEHGLSMVTLAGNNNGATMRSELDDKSGTHSHGEEPEALSTYVNSNFQAINNSLMLGGSYHANDPGVHLDISDFSTEPHQSHHHKEERHGKKGKKIEKKLPNPKNHHHHLLIERLILVLKASNLLSARRQPLGLIVKHTNHILYPKYV